MKKGFTIVEAMIVVSIVGILAAIAIPSFIKARDKAELDHELSKAMSSGDTNISKVVGIINERKYKPEFLFEYDGVRVYRFIDDDDISSASKYKYFSKEVGK
jgi:prepilin-type N-terminal cleavage/methylation domain-containing protein